MVGYNLSNIMASNESGLLDFVVDVNTILMKNWLGDIFLIGFAVILFSSFWLSTADVPKSMMGTSFIIFILSMSFGALGLSHTITPFVAVFFLVLGIVFSYSSR